MTLDIGGAVRGVFTLWVLVASAVWVAVAVAASWLADEKGRSPTFWFFVGLLAGPFAVVLVGFAPRGASGQFRRCRQCREPIRREALVCPCCRVAAPTEVEM